MEDKLISRYDILVNRYKELVSEKLSRKDFIEYNEILFSAHSCAIEGNSFSVDETRTLKEKGLGMIPKGKTLLEAFEILDHFQADRGPPEGNPRAADGTYPLLQDPIR